MALCGEIGELAHHFQWLTETESNALSDEKKRAVAEEAADVLLYLVMLSDSLGIDILKEAARKIDKNESRYPVDKSKGSSSKYSDL